MTIRLRNSNVKWKIFRTRQSKVFRLEFKDVVTKRYSVRGYASTPVSDDTIRKLFDIVRYAPSAYNNQPWIFIVVRSPKGREALCQSYNRKWFADAPVLIAVGYDTLKSWKRSDGKDYGIVDCTIAMDHLTLAATELGLGTCWVGAFDDSTARNALQIPKSVELVALTPLGFPATTQGEKRRDPADTYLYWEHFGDKHVKMSCE